MKKISLLAALLPICLAATHAQAQSATPPAPLARAENAFAVDLYGKLRQQPGNLFFSPYSIATSVGMAYAGARGGTAAEIARVLHLDMLEQNGPHADLRAAFLQAARQRPVPQSAGAGDFQFYAANALWGAKGYAFNQRFIATIKNSFGGDLEPVDFREAQAARNRINGWVAGQTQNKIQDLIGPGVLSRHTRMVLTNAVYFKAKWQFLFEAESTKKGIFHIAADKHVDVAMMNMRMYFPLAMAKEVKVLSLPYDYGTVSMVIILPNRKDDLRKIEAGLSATTLNRWLASARVREVSLSLPRFKTRCDFDLRSTLMALGMKKAFIPSEADLTGIADVSRRPLYISDVIHQAFVGVDENGTEATAATAVTVTASAGAAMPGPPPVRFNANHPFIYLIRDNRSGEILFMGRVADPVS